MIKRFLIPPPPAHLRKNFIPLSDLKNKEIEKLFFDKYYLKEKEFRSENETILVSQNELKEHVAGRVTKFRMNIIPWIDSVLPLKGAKILEIGCGTGSSTFALAEQGADVTAVDIISEHLEIAKKRLELYGLRARFEKANAIEVDKLLNGEKFDLIIFFAALEHMTVEERIEAIRRTWNMLPDGKFWCITGSPNRLWFFDDHTSNLPFFHWLPDNLAFLYSKFSPNESINKLYREINENSMLHFLRRGRGISYHEFECAIGTVSDLKIVSALSSFTRKNVFRKAKWFFSRNHRYERILMKEGIPIHRGFYQPYLDLIIQKK